MLKLEEKLYSAHYEIYTYNNVNINKIQSPNHHWSGLCLSVLVEFSRCDQRPDSLE